MVTIKTSRLILRQWKDSDLAPFAALNADPRVREFFPGLQSREESDHDAQRIADHIAKYGWGFWAVSLIETDEFIGFIGLNKVHFQAHFTPAVEVGWRLAFDYWGKGYATEGAKAALTYGFETLNLNEIVSFTSVQNMRSRRIMEKIGMHHIPEDDFDHPKLAKDHPLKRHVLYRMTQKEWRCYMVEDIACKTDVPSPVHLIYSEQEKKKALHFRQKEFFDQRGFKDPYAWSLDAKDHLHWLLYERDKVIGYAHVQIWPEHRAALRIIVIHEQNRIRGRGKLFDGLLR